MKTKLFSSIATIPLIVTGVVTSTGLVNAATVGSGINFSGYVFGSSNQFDYIDSSASPLVPNPNVEGNFKVLDATGSFVPALMNPSQLGTIRDIHTGTSSGLITQTGPLFDGSDNSSFYVPNFLSLTTLGLVDFTFQLETVNRVVVIDPDSPNPSDPFILRISSTLTGTLTDLITNEAQAAVGTFVPNIPPGINVSQLTPDNFLGPVLYNGSLQVVPVPEPGTSAGLALLGVFSVVYVLNKRKKFPR